MTQVGDKVSGISNSPTIDNYSNAFEGVVIEVDSAETSDIGEEQVLVRYTSPGAWEKLHRIKQDWYLSADLNG